MFKTMLIGNLAAAPIFREVQLKSGEIVHACNFTVYVNNRNSANAEPIRVQVTTWRGLADACHQYLDKGRKVYVEGQMVAQLGEDKNTGKFYANNVLNATTVEFVSPRNQQNTSIPSPDEIEEEPAPAPAPKAPVTRATATRTQTAATKPAPVQRKTVAKKAPAPVVEEFAEIGEADLPFDV